MIVMAGANVSLHLRLLKLTGQLLTLRQSQPYVIAEYSRYYSVGK